MQTHSGVVRSFKVIFSTSFPLVLALTFFCRGTVQGALADGEAAAVSIKETVLNLLNVNILHSVANRTEDGTTLTTNGLATLTLPDPVGSFVRANVLNSTSTSTVIIDPVTGNAVQNSQAEVSNLRLLDGLVTATLVRAQTGAISDGFSATLSTNGSAITDLVINGQAIPEVVPNLRVELPEALFGSGSYVMVFETLHESTVPSGIQGGTYSAEVTVNMIRVHVTDLNPALPGDQQVEIIAAHARSYAEFSQAPPVIISISNLSVQEPAETAEANFSVVLSRTNNLPITVDFATADGTAIAGEDYLPASGTLTFLPGITNVMVPVTVLGDSLFENNETFEVNLLNPTLALLGNSRGLGEIVDNDPAPQLSVEDIVVTEGDEGVNPAVFVIRLSAASGKDAVFSFVTRDGSALAHSDYTPRSGMGTIPAGSLSLNVQVDILGDPFHEPSETFSLQLSDSVNSSLLKETGIATILDTDALPQISVNDAAASEQSGASLIHFTITLSKPHNQPVTVSYSTADHTAIAGQDYSATGGTLTFGIAEISKTVGVEILPDSLDEFDESFFLNLSNPINGTLGDDQGIGTILDNDPLPLLSVSPVTVVEGNSGITLATFVVDLLSVSEKTIAVDYATRPGSAGPLDYNTVSGSLTFPPGVTQHLVHVEVLGDTLVELDEQFDLVLSRPANADFAQNAGIGSILNDDQAKVALDLSITAIPDPVKVGCELLYTLVVSNKSEHVCSGLVLTQNIPTNSVFEAALAEQGDFTFEDGVVTFQMGTLQPHSILQAKVVVIPQYGMGAVTTAMIDAVDLDAQVSKRMETEVTEIQSRLPFKADPISINRQTGLYEQVVWVTNINCSTLTATRVRIHGTTTNRYVNNLTGLDIDGVPFVQTSMPLHKDGVIRYKIEYVSKKGEVPNMEFEALAAPVLTPQQKVNGTIVPSFMLPRKDGSVLLQFKAIPQRTYTISYSDDLLHWKTSVPSVITESDAVFWIDDGPPKTDTHPSTTSKRFYQIILEDELKK